MRPANEVDFWRGLALVCIFANHIPGFLFERFTPRNIGLSDSAELFVFLAGWALRRLADDARDRPSLLRLVLRLGARAVTLYAAQILITALAIGITAAAALWLDNPLLLEWNNSAAVFQDPASAHIGLVLLTHQLGYFDILPLYVVLMLSAPGLALVHYAAPRLVLPLSGAMYVATLATGFNLPTWPVEGTWYFAPFAWQLVFTLGFTLAGPRIPARADRLGRIPLRVAGLAVAVAGAWAALSDYEPDPLRVPWPPLFFILDKTFDTPARVIHLLGLVALFAGSFGRISRAARPLARFLSMLGRNSLNVFCVGSLMSLTGQIVRFGFGHGIGTDCALLGAGVAAMGFTAWLSELRDRLRRSEPALSRLPSA